MNEKLKNIVLDVVRHSPLDPESQEKLLYWGKFRDSLNLENPLTYNEKVNWRKLRCRNPLYVTCADKLAAREYVKEKIGGEYLIPLLYSGESITPEVLAALGDDIVVKANHDSGSAVIIRKNSIEEARKACKRMDEALAYDFGKETNQWWYAEIPRRVMVESLILNEEGVLAYDFKFFVFRQPDGKRPKMYIQLDCDRGTPNYHRAFYNEDHVQVESSGQGVVLDGVPNKKRDFPELENYDEFVRIVHKLADDFDHVRVDMYYARGRIYFGELTFSDGGGRSEWHPNDLDRELGDCWHLDTSYQTG
ncbi:MAG: hypothetical protein CMO55_23990 [Verrucomicrobiales bacterium]|nr:hypothetical protein [Verrucomicrobiales bacterium]